MITRRRQGWDKFSNRGSSLVDWTPFQRERVRDDDDDNDGGASISPSHRNGCHDRKVSQPLFNQRLHEDWPFEDQRRPWIDEAASIQFICSDFIVAGPSPSFPTNRLTFYSLSRAHEARRFPAIPRRSERKPESRTFALFSNARQGRPSLVRQNWFDRAGKTRVTRTPILFGALENPFKFRAITLMRLSRIVTDTHILLCKRDGD